MYGEKKKIYNKSLENLQKRDIEKTNFCLKNNIKLLRICYKDIKYIKSFIKSSIAQDVILIISDLYMYNFILNKIEDDITFLTGVGE